MIKKHKRHSLIAYILAAIIFLIGFYGSFILNNWLWFSRSGSLMVIIGIILTSSQIIENSRRLRQRYQGKLRVDNFNKDWARDLSNQDFLHARDTEEESWILGKCGFNLLITGTLIWGFGDLLKYIF